MKNVILSIALLVFSLSGLSAQTEINDDNFEGYLDNKDDTLVVMDFYATWCGPCKKMEPVLKDLERKYRDVNFYKMDIDENFLDEILELTSVPTYVFVKNGEPLEIVEGAIGEEAMIDLIEKYK